MDQFTFDLMALTLVPGLGARRIHRFLGEIGDPGEIFRFSRRQLGKLRLGPEGMAAVAGGLCRRQAEKAIETARSSGVKLVSFRDPSYPQLLGRIFDPPLILYLRGRTELLREPAIAVVGSRKCSVYGRQVTRKLAGEVAEQGLVVVSGLARGIDTLAHQGTLQKGGGTIAVLGTGIDVEYPFENRRIQREIGEIGCLVSEFTFGVYPAPQNFPIRNRIISGLSLGTLIPEAGEFSGSLITARLTLEQDRELFAVPGNITSPNSLGPNLLIKQGAHPVLGVQDILDALPVPVLQQLRARAEEAPEPAEPEPEAKGLLRRLEVDRATHFDVLLRESGLDQGRLSSLLFDLEIQGWIKQVPGRLYFRVL